MTLCCQMSCAVLGGSGRRLRSSLSFFSDSALRTASRRLNFSYTSKWSGDRWVCHMCATRLWWPLGANLPSFCLAARSTCGPAAWWARCPRGLGAPVAAWDASPRRRWTWLRWASWVSLDWPANDQMHDSLKAHGKKAKKKHVFLLSAALTLAFGLFFFDAGLLEPLPLLKPIFSSDKTRCCSSSDKDCRCAQEKRAVRKKDLLHLAQAGRGKGRLMAYLHSEICSSQSRTLSSSEKTHSNTVCQTFDTSQDSPRLLWTPSFPDCALTCSQRFW